MSTWAARYVRLRDREADLARVRALVDPGATLVDDGVSPFVVWSVPSPTFSPDDLASLSRGGEAISIAVQTVADLVIYDHFVDGARVRGLSYAGEAGWTRVVGEPEAWEAGALFSPAKLEELRAELEDDLTEDALARETAELEQLWAARTLREGGLRPPVDPTALARAIERHFRLTARPASARDMTPASR
jgi:hypothetical protein